MNRDPARKTPDELLTEVQAEEAAAARGHLKIFLGYASGVGKSFRMLDEARRRRERGQDVVVGAVQPKVPPDVASLLNQLEVIPLKTCGEGTAIDVAVLMRRHPAVCFIDGLAYDNPPGLRNPTRWQDVQDLVAGGIKVIGTINIYKCPQVKKSEGNAFYDKENRHCRKEMISGANNFPISIVIRTSCLENAISFSLCLLPQGQTMVLIS